MITTPSQRRHLTPRAKPSPPPTRSGDTLVPVRTAGPRAHHRQVRSMVVGRSTAMGGASVTGAGVPLFLGHGGSAPRAPQGAGALLPPFTLALPHDLPLPGGPPKVAHAALRVIPPQAAPDFPPSFPQTGRQHAGGGTCPSPVTPALAHESPSQKVMPIDKTLPLKSLGVTPFTPPAPAPSPAPRQSSRHPCPRHARSPAGRRPCHPRWGQWSG